MHYIYIITSSMKAWDLFYLPSCGWGLTLYHTILGCLLFLCFWLFLVYRFNSSTGITICVFCSNIINNTSFNYAMEHLLQIVYDADWISWEYMCNLHFLYCHNAWFFISEKLSFSSNSVFDYFKNNTLLKMQKHCH